MQIQAELDVSILIYIRILGQNANDKIPLSKTPMQKMLNLTPNTLISGISYIGGWSVAFRPDTTSRHV